MTEFPYMEDFNPAPPLPASGSAGLPALPPTEAQDAPPSSFGSVPMTAPPAAPQASSFAQPTSLRDPEDQQLLDALPARQKIALAMQTFGSALAGGPNPVDQMLDRRRQTKEAFRTSLVNNVKLLNDSLAIAEKLPPEHPQRAALTEMVERAAGPMGPMARAAMESAGTADAARIKSMLATVSTPAAQTMLANASGGNPKEMQRLLADSDFVKRMDMTSDQATLPDALQKIRVLAQAVAKMPGQKFRDASGSPSFSMAELMAENANLPPEFRLSAPQIEALNRNQAAASVYGLKTDKTLQVEQETAARGESKAPQMRTRTIGENEVQEEFDPITKTWKQIGQGPRFAKQVAGPAEGPALSAQQSKLTGDEFLATLAPEDAKLVKRIAAGLQDVKDLSTRGGHREKFIKLAGQYDPSYNSADYSTMKGVERAFTVGMEGRKVRSFNVALEHIETLDGLAAALKNGNVQKFNQVAQVLAEQTGKPAPTDFNAAKQIVADETIAALVAGGGALADREEAARVWSNLKSPDQLAGVSRVMKELMGGQLKGLHQQYKSGGGTKDFAGFLTAAGKKASGMQEKPKTPAAAGPFSDAEKERRYQEWKARQSK